MDDLIRRQDAVECVYKALRTPPPKGVFTDTMSLAIGMVNDLPPAQSERLTDDDFETIRIHLNAYKENLCNQHRWKEAEEYQRIIDRFMAVASAQPEITETQVKEYCEKRCLVVLTVDAFYRLKSAQPERKKGKWEYVDVDYRCSVCHKYAYGCLGEVLSGQYKYCPYCGTAMEGEK